MPFDTTIKRLLKARRIPRDVAAEAERRLARTAWVIRTSAELRKAQREMDRRCGAAVGKIGEAEFNRLVEEEQAKVCAFLDPLRAAADEDKWPRELYWSL